MKLNSRRYAVSKIHRMQQQKWHNLHIISIDKLILIPAINTQYLHTSDKIIGMLSKSKKNLAIRILICQIIINDADPVMDYGPSYNSAMAYKSAATHFAIFTLLYDTDMVLFDPEAES
ncbi:MAG: DUF3179 domain-containing (seleno)protein [Gammaproteobacteria bacterium]|nr:DUF3179 domain-containing (seleno)protein [Gammaproteobacteria bacterium]